MRKHPIAESVGVMSTSVGVMSASVGLMSTSVEVMSESVDVMSGRVGLKSTSVEVMSMSVGLTADSVGVTASSIGLTASCVDYTYDANGNMILDKNKGITEIFYNHLNLPEYISFANGNAIEYLYNAAGAKVKKKVYNMTAPPSGNIKEVEYLDGFQYAGGILQFFPHAEGYVSATLNANAIGGNQYIFNYVYNYTDHLGNIRLSYSKDPVNNQLKILEENHYYPFGLKHAVYSAGSLQQYQLVDNLPGTEPTARPSYVCLQNRLPIQVPRARITR